MVKIVRPKKVEYYVICAVHGDGNQEYCYEVNGARVPAGEPIGVESDEGHLILLEGILYDNDPNDLLEEFGEPDEYEVIYLSESDRPDYLNHLGDKPVAIKNMKTHKISFLTGVTNKIKREVAAREL